MTVFPILLYMHGFKTYAYPSHEQQNEIWFPLQKRFNPYNRLNL